MCRNDILIINYREIVDVCRKISAICFCSEIGGKYDFG